MCIQTILAQNGLSCADVPLRNHSLARSPLHPITHPYSYGHFRLLNKLTENHSNLLAANPKLCILAISCLNSDDLKWLNFSSCRHCKKSVIEQLYIRYRFRDFYVDHWVRLASHTCSHPQVVSLLFILAINPTPPKAYRRKRITQGFRISRTCRSFSKIK